MSGWQLDPYSALFGAALTVALIGLGYWLREPFLRGCREARAVLWRFFGWIAAGAEERYRQAVVKWAQRSHALARLGPLESVFVAPRLIPPPLQPDPNSDHPPFSDPLSLGVALRGHQRLLLLGDLASGRSTLLAYLALVHARREAGAQLGLPAERLPLCVSLPDIDWSACAEKVEAARLADLAQAALRTVSALSAAAGVIRQHLQAGACLVLVDGWDRLGRPEQEQAAAWLASLANAMPGNLWLVATCSRGYAPLVEAGFVALRLEGWQRPQVESLLRRVADRLPPLEEGEPRKVRRAGDALLRALEREPSLLDLALRAWLLLDAGEAPYRRGELFSEALARLLGASTDTVWLAEAGQVALSNLAQKMRQESRSTISKKEIAEALEAALPPAEERPPRAASQALEALTAVGGPLVSQGADGFTFTHSLWQAFLLTRQGDGLPVADLVENLDDPAWLPVLDFYAEAGPMGPVVEAWLARPDDIWRTRLCIAARWAAYAPTDAPWRNGVLALLARSFLDPALPERTRKRLGASLVWTGDPGVVVFLRQAMQHALEPVRVAAVSTMGLLRERADVDALAAAFEDPSEAVRAAAIAALGDAGIAAAIRRLAEVLAAGDDTLRVEAARALARVGEEGWQVLREALEEDDFLTRRAAVYGLGEIRADWARAALERVARDDDQWLVRSVASAALSEAGQARTALIDPLPVVSELAWLNTWAAERGEGVGIGEAAFGPLLCALEEGDPAIRRAAAQVVGLVGRPGHVAALQQAAQDPHPEVAQMAFWALEELSCRYDLLVR